MTTYARSLYKDIDVFGYGEHLNLETWTIIHEGQPVKYGAMTWRPDDHVTGHRYRVSNGEDVLAVGETSSLTIYPSDDEHPRIRVQLGGRHDD